MLDEQFPLVLAPDPDLLSKSLGELLETEADGQPKTVEFHRDQKTKGWLLNYRGQDLFSFDLAPRLLRLSLEHGGLAFADESTLHLDVTLVNLGKQIGGFDNRIHTLKLSISRDMLRQLQFELDREPIVEEEEEDE